MVFCIFKRVALETSRMLNRKDLKQIANMGFKLLLLMAMGLGAMYMMHLLAQDYNKIRQPVAAAARALTKASAKLTRGKRNVVSSTDVRSRDQILKHGPQRPRIPRQQQQNTVGYNHVDETVSSPLRNTSLSIDWKRILSRDPFECLQSLICQIMSGAEGSSKEAILLMDFLEASLAMAPAKIGRAFSRGLALRGQSERCYDEYPFCLYSAKTMLRVLRWFSKGYIEEQ